MGTCCVYFTSDRPPPVAEPVLFLDGDGDKLVNNCCFPSSVAESYAPAGKTLVSASTVGTQDDLSDDALVEVCARALLSFPSLAPAQWCLGDSRDACLQPKGRRWEVPPKSHSSTKLETTALTRMLRVLRLLCSATPDACSALCLVLHCTAQLDVSSPLTRMARQHPRYVHGL